MRLSKLYFSLLLIGVGGSPPLVGQQITWRSQFDFYGDNTEFFTPYRVGETLFGARVASWLDLGLGPRTSVWVGVEADRRWGGEGFVDSLKPLLSFRYQTAHSRFHLGALDNIRRHGLLDAVMVSTRELTTGAEFGAQWMESRRYLHGDVWLNWQKLNTPVQREGFEMGAVAALTPVEHLKIDAQHLWSHRGGQLYNAGQLVANNRVTLLGATVSKSFPLLHESSLSVHQLWSVAHLDARVGDTRPEEGGGTLARVSVRPRGWAEVFALTWWGKDYSTAAGDANYGSQGHAADFYRSKRRYTEIGMIRTATIEKEISFDLEARFHRIDDEESIAFFNSPWEFSYRVMVKVPFGIVVRQ